MRMFRNHNLEEPQGPSTQIRSAGIKSMPRKHTITNVCLEICFETFIWQYLNQIYFRRKQVHDTEVCFETLNWRYLNQIYSVGNKSRARKYVLKP